VFGDINRLLIIGKDQKNTTTVAGTTREVMVSAGALEAILILVRGQMLAYCASQLPVCGHNSTVFLLQEAGKAIQERVASAAAVYSVRGKNKVIGQSVCTLVVLSVAAIICQLSPAVKLTLKLLTLSRCAARRLPSPSNKQRRHCGR
jgi:hypothetical protein